MTSGVNQSGRWPGSRSDRRGKRSAPSISPTATSATAQGARKRLASIAIAEAAMNSQIRNSTAEVALIGFIAFEAQ